MPGAEQRQGFGGLQNKRCQHEGVANDPVASARLGHEDLQ
jgi:hypothetical protein